MNTCLILIELQESQSSRVDYDTFHKAVEALVMPASSQTTKMAHIPVSASDVRGPTTTQPSQLQTGRGDVIQHADFDQGLEFEGEDPSIRAAKRDVCRKIRHQLQSRLTMPRKAFLTVDKNRDGLLSRDELRGCVDY